jgi:hypothetical protein
MTMENATVTVTFEGKSASFDLEGDELSRTIWPDGREHVYFTTASRDFIAEGVLKALLTITKEA